MEGIPVHDVTIWLLVANTLVIATMVAYRGMVRPSLVPVRVPAQLAQFKANRVKANRVKRERL